MDDPRINLSSLDIAAINKGYHSSTGKMAALIESTTLPVTAFYAGLLSILFAYLALRVGLTRANNGVMHGDGGKQDMVRKARVSLRL